MEYKAIQSLIKLIDSTNLAEFKMKEGEFELQIRTKEFYKVGKHSGTHLVSTPVMQSSPASVNQPAVENAGVSQEATSSELSSETSQDANTEGTKESTLLDIKSPIVGTFYRSPSPDKDPYIKMGDHIDAGSIVCIVEAMKLFNEIETEVSGKVVEILVEDSTPVEYDQVLFRVEPV